MSVPTAASRLTIFCGKGGVGKTTLALSYALGKASQGQSAVVVTSHPLQELAVSVSLSGFKERLPEAASHLFIIHIDPRDILKTKVRQQIPSATLAKAVLSSQIYSTLVEVAPGLKELAFLTRLRQLAEERTHEGQDNKFDLLVWDAPATGHFLQTLKVSRNFDTYLSGPFAAMGKQLAQFFSDPSNFALIPVTTLEEMAVEETLELCGNLAGELEMRSSTLICNMASPLLAAGDSVPDDLGQQLAREGMDSADLRRILGRHEAERSLFRKLRSAIAAEVCVVERKPSWDSDLDLLLDLSRQMEKLPQAGAP